MPTLPAGVVHTTHGEVIRSDSVSKLIKLFKHLCEFHFVIFADTAELFLEQDFYGFLGFLPTDIFMEVPKGFGYNFKNL